MPNRRKIIAVSVGVVALAASAFAVLVTSASATNLDKVFVCKYVGTPGVNETLQTGQNPIDVSINAIPNYQGVGSEFADAQGRSVVIGPEHAANDQVEEPDVSDCPQPNNECPAETLRAEWTETTVPECPTTTTTIPQETTTVPEKTTTTEAPTTTVPEQTTTTTVGEKPRTPAPQVPVQQAPAQPTELPHTL